MTTEELDKLYESERDAIRDWHEEHGAGANSYAADAEVDELYRSLYGND